MRTERIWRDIPFPHTTDVGRVLNWLLLPGLLRLLLNLLLSFQTDLGYPFQTGSWKIPSNHPSEYQWSNVWGTAALQ